MAEKRFRFQDSVEPSENPNSLPETERHEVYGYNPENDEWRRILWRDSLGLKHGRLIGDVSPKKVVTSRLSGTVISLNLLRLASRQKKNER